MWHTFFRSLFVFSFCLLLILQLAGWAAFVRAEKIKMVLSRFFWLRVKLRKRQKSSINLNILLAGNGFMACGERGRAGIASFVVLGWLGSLSHLNYSMSFEDNKGIRQKIRIHSWKQINFEVRIYTKIDIRPPFRVTTFTMHPLLIKLRILSRHCADADGIRVTSAPKIFLILHYV